MNSDENAVAELFGTIARELLHETDPQATLAKTVQLARDHLDGCESAGVSIIEHRSITSPASAGDIAARLDALQQELDEGPCLDALREQEVFTTGDLTTETRWPRFARRANDETGARSVLSLRLFVDEHTMGALNLYSTQTDAFDQTAIAIGTIFAAHAAIALSSARQVQNLQRQTASRDIIGRAKGMLMAQRHVTDDEAFALLRHASQHLNTKLFDIAEEMNRTGELPGEPRQP
jgi:GAF domain-containing protein